MRDSLLEMNNREAIARASNARLDPPPETETPVVVPEGRKCEDCSAPLTEDYDGDICVPCAERVQSKTALRQGR